MTKRKKIRRTILIIILLGLALLIARALIDAPPPNDADLLITYEDIPDEENAVTYFNLAAERLRWPEDPDQERRLDHVLDEDGWDQALADEILAENDGIFDLIEIGLACSFFQVPEITDYDTLLPYLQPWRILTKLAAIRAEHLFRQSKEKEALDQVVTLIRFAKRTQDGHGCLMNYLVGIAIKEVAQSQLIRMLARTTLSHQVLSSYIHRLDDGGASEEGLADAFRVEYRCAVAYVDGVGSGRPAMMKFIYKHALLKRLFVKPNKTKRRLAEAYRTLMANVPKLYSKRAQLEISKPRGAFEWARVVLSGNFGGSVAYGNLMSGLPRFHASKCRENCAIAATQILIALKCYKLEHGELPDTLDQLVPKYFPKIPLDDFDGRPMRYSKEKRVVYTIGTDLKDSGGADKTSPNVIEPTYKIEF